jgi:hypothetical protein
VSLRIEDDGLIGDTQTVALVGPSRQASLARRHHQYGTQISHGAMDRHAPRGNGGANLR